MLNTENCILLLIDFQEKLINMLAENNQAALNAEKLLKAANILGIPSILTEQYPKGLGDTVEFIKNANKNVQYFEKTTFSAIATDTILSAIKASGRKQIILGGIETHICVLQTALELLAKGYEVYLVQDACASRKNDNFATAISRMTVAGVVLTDTEITLFELLKSSRHDNFKEIQALIK